LQTKSSNLEDAASKMQGQTNSNQQCIVAMVEKNYQCCCCDIKIDVPANFTVLEEKCGAS